LRPLALFLRAGAVVVALGIVFSLLVDGAPAPATSSAEAAAATRAAKKAAAAEKAVRKKVAAKKASAARSAAASSRVTVVAVGDIVMGSTPNLPPDGGRSFFDGVQTDLAGDVVLGNLEGTLSVGGGSKCGAGSTNCYAFQTPPSYAAWLKKAGFTVLNLANNHAYDFGPTGQTQTLAALKKQRLRTTGRPGEIAYQQVGDAKVAIVGFAPYAWAQSLTDIPAARRLVQKAAATADVVIVSMHAGAEGSDKTHVRRGTEIFLGENRGDPVAFSHAVIDAGADLVVGHGPHVLRGMEWYKGRLIAYSLGNFAGYKVFALGGPLSLSGVLRVTLRGDGAFDSGTLVPTRMVGAGLPALDPAESAHGIVRTLSKDDFGARAVKVSPNGTLSR
jgi:poly-gamma-glutamate capsule biosynthesis protein CapA/YwtB (metallophosphatase superfamily)